MSAVVKLPEREKVPMAAEKQRFPPQERPITALVVSFLCNSLFMISLSGALLCVEVLA